MNIISLFLIIIMAVVISFLHWVDDSDLSGFLSVLYILTATSNELNLPTQINRAGLSITSPVYNVLVHQHSLYIHPPKCFRRQREVF